MNTLDYLTFGGYLVALYVIGAVLARRNRTVDAMFTLNGRADWRLVGISVFMSMFSAGTFVVWGGVAYELGLVAIMINLCYALAAFVVGIVLAGRWQRLRLDSPARFFELRWNFPVLPSSCKKFCFETHVIYVKS